MLHSVTLTRCIKYIFLISNICISLLPVSTESNQAEFIVSISESMMRTLRARAAVRADARGGDGDGGRDGTWGTVLIALGGTCVIPNPDHRHYGVRH